MEILKNDTVKQLLRGPTGLPGLTGAPGINGLAIYLDIF
jgi:hypothetical protein